MRVTIKKTMKTKINKDSADVIMLGHVVPYSFTAGDDLFEKEDLDLRFHIRPLCIEPSSFKSISGTNEDESDYVVFGAKVKKIEEITRNAVLTDETERELTNYLSSNFFIFKPYVNFKESSSVNSGAGIVTIDCHKNISGSLMTLPIGDFDPNASYIRLPKLSISLEELATTINRAGKVELVNYPASLSTPFYILFEDYIVHFSSDNISTIDSQGFRWFLGGDVNKVSVHALTSDDYACIIQTGNYISFIDAEVLDEMDFSTPLLQEIEHIKNSGTETVEKLITETLSTPIIRDIVPAAEIMKKAEPDSMEITFLKSLSESCQRDGLLYLPKDLVNFHVSVKTNFLTIITGATGTGKSQLAVKYAEHLCGTSRLIIPVETSFLESDDVIGYLNISTGIYHPSRTGLVDFLIEAAQHEEKMYFVIFDEMNLAQVEHWFAPFIAMLEQKEKTLKLYSGYCLNADHYPEKLKITNNVRFIGTINLDETVKEFSDRLLDRTNLVELHKPLFSEIMEIDTDPHIVDGQQPGAYTASIYQEWIKKDGSGISLNKGDVMMFESLTTLIENTDHRKGVSFRVLQCINHYLNNIPQCSNAAWTISKDEAIDLQVSQRIISKFKGTPQSLRGLITASEEQDKSCPLLSFFITDKYKSVSEFVQTKALINRKIRELKNYGYTY